MPRQGNHSGKSIFFEAIFVIGFLVVVGHLGANFWEKYFIQTEIAEVKSSLNHLKKTIANIGYAYDNLNQEMNGLTAHSVTENDLPSVHTASVGHKYKSKYTVDRRHNNDVKVKSTIAAQRFTKWDPIYKDNKTLNTEANVNVTTNTNTKIAEDFSTVVRKANESSGAKSTFISNKRSAAKAKSTITPNTRPTVDSKGTITTNTRPVVEVSTVTTDRISDAKRTLTTRSRLAANVSRGITNRKPVSDVKSTITTNTRPVAEVSTVTSNRKPVSDAKSTITTNTRAHVDAKSTITTNTRPDVSTITSKIKTAEDVSTITRHPLKSTAVGLCHQDEDCIHEHHCKHNNFYYHKDNQCYRQGTLKF